MASKVFIKSLFYEMAHNPTKNTINCRTSKQDKLVNLYSEVKIITVCLVAEPDKVPVGELINVLLIH